jgi:hypothetical protein
MLLFPVFHREAWMILGLGLGSYRFMVYVMRWKRLLWRASEMNAITVFGFLPLC